MGIHVAIVGDCLSVAGSDAAASQLAIDLNGIMVATPVFHQIAMQVVSARG